MINLLIIEDSEETRDFLKIILSDEININILEASSVAEGLKIVKKEIPNIILLDLSLPDGSGSSICKEVRDNPDFYGSPFILALTADTSQESVNTNLELGCDDYIKKPFDPKELLIRIKKFTSRIPKDKEFLQYENIKIFLNNKVVSYNNENIVLSKNEFELLSYFILNRGLLLTRVTILDNVWNENFDISDKAVDTSV